MKKVLIISYYWPPTGGSGVQRWLKFCKYLRDFGWEPIVYTPANPDVDLVDPTLEDDIPEDLQVIRQPITEPRRIYRSLTSGRTPSAGSTGSAGIDELIFLDRAERSTKQNALVWIRSNVFVPDARVLWVRPSVKFLMSYLERNPVDAVVSTGPPQSLHLIGRALKRKLGIPWLADFRDPWTGIVYFDRLPLAGWAERKHRRLESSVLQEADAVVSVSDIWSRSLEELGAQKVDTITNGFDESDVSEAATDEADELLEPGFVLSHVGFLTGDRTPNALWQAVAELCRESNDFDGDLRIRFVGQIDDAVVEGAESHGVATKIERVGYVPHLEAVRFMRRSQVLVLIIAETAPGWIPGKLFEYLAARRPILLLGPRDGEAARILAASGAGITAPLDDPAAVKSALSELYNRFKTGTFEVDASGLEQFSRRNLTGQLAAVLHRIAD